MHSKKKKTATYKTYKIVSDSGGKAERFFCEAFETPPCTTNSTNVTN